MNCSTPSPRISRTSHDLIAERVTQLGGVANGTARQAAADSTIKEYDFRRCAGRRPRSRPGAADWVRSANAARKAIDDTGKLGDQATADVFTVDHARADKDLWFLEAHLQG